jgi:nucleotide-binding universal stress UspA family protein
LIVVGVDFSEGSCAAVTAGRMLAEDRDEPLRVVHILRDNSGPWQPGPEASNWLRSNAVEPGELEVRRGVPWVELVRAAEEWGAHFVVAGTHGSTGFQPFRLGNTASMLALRCRTPVVLAPARQPTNNPKERK